MAPLSHAAFSDDLELFALCSADGKLKLFDTKSNKLVQEFVPDGHLNGLIRSLCWISAPPQLELQASKQGSKKRRVVVEDCPDKKFLLLGQSDGNILLYNSNSAETVGKLTSDLSSPINAIAWAKGNDVFAGLSNGQIARWTLPNSQCVKSWKSGKKGASIAVLAIHPREPWLISASRSITVWDIETQKPLQTFLGHENLIRQLLFTPSGDHLASIASVDRNVNVWPLHKVKSDGKGPSSDPVAMFVLQDYPVQMDVAVSSEDGSVKLSAVTEEGSLNIFSEAINGKCVTTSKPMLTIQIAQSETPANAAVELLPILAARFRPDNLKNMLITYGDSFNMRFEKVAINGKKSLLVLERANPRKPIQEKETGSRIKGSIKEAQYVTAAGTKRPVSSKPIHLPIEDRLKNLSVDKFEGNESRIPSGPTSDSLSELLQQGLTSSDQKMQKEILLKRDPSVISSTVAELPVKFVPTLVQELVVLVHWRGWKGEAAAKWLNEVLMHHSSLVLGSPQLVSMIQPILSLVEVRLAALHNLSRLKGRLALLLAQMTLRGKLKKMSPQQNDVTTFDIDDESDNSSDEDNLSLADSDSQSEAEDSEDEMEEDENVEDSEDQDWDKEDEEVEDEEEDEEEKPKVNGNRSKRKIITKGDTDEEMDEDC